MSHTPALVTFHCRKCRVALSNPLAKAQSAHLRPQPDQNFVPAGEWTVAGGDEGFEANVFVINLEDVTNWQNHPDARRLSGCCGPTADMNLMNLRCVNRHDVGGTQSECYLPHGIAFHPLRVFLTDGEAPPLPVTAADELAAATEASSAVRPLAAGIAEDDELSGLPILADALEEAGLQNDTVLAHLRGGYLHYGGCLVIDAILSPCPGEGPA